MLNTVHGRSLRVCQWTGESLDTYYKIPQKGLKEFKGCFGSPSVCISAIMAHAEKENLATEETHELIDMFQSSLFRKPGFENEKYTINAAPNWSMLKRWGGELDLDQYHRLYDHDKQNSMYYQNIPKCVQLETAKTELKERAEAVAAESSAPATATNFEYDSDPDRAPNAPKRWRVNKLGASASVSEPVENRVVMPRCITSCIEFFKEAYPGKSALVIYMDPHTDKAFALGLPEDWMGKGNRRASDVLGKIPVYGNVTLYHKYKSRLFGWGKKKTKEIPMTDEKK